MSRRMWIGIWLGLALAVLSIAWLVGSRGRQAAAFLSVHAPYPSVVLLSQSAHAAWPDGLRVARRYQALGAYRDVVEWYQGKDSLLPVPSTLPPGCFHQSFRRNPSLFHRILRSQIEEQVTVCSVGGRTTVTSITLIRPPRLAP